MKKQFSRASAGSTHKEQTTTNSRSTAAKTTQRYIYTEEDLGEDILYAGISTGYTAGKDGLLYARADHRMAYAY